MFRFFLLFVATVVCTVQSQNTCGDLLASDPDLSVLNTAVQAVGGLTLTDTVVFAPVNEAFATNEDATLDRITTNPIFKAQLRALLLNHAVAGADTAVLDEEDVTTLAGESLSVEMEGEGDIVVEGFAETEITVLETVEADDCVIHKVDGVITPLWWDVQILDLAASDIPGLKNLTTVFKELDQQTVTLATAVPAVTIFAPSDVAFAKLGEAVAYALLENDMVTPLLLNHLVLNANVASEDLGDEVIPTLAPTLVLPVTRTTNAEGEEVIMIGDATVVMKDIFANNGIVHVIDQVLLGSIELPVVNTTTPTVVPVTGSTGAPVANPTSMAPMTPVAVTTAPVQETAASPTAAPAMKAVTEAPMAVPATTGSPVMVPPPAEEPKESEVTPISAAGPATMLGVLGLIACMVL